MMTIDMLIPKKKKPKKYVEHIIMVTTNNLLNMRDYFAIGIRKNKKGVLVAEIDLNKEPNVCLSMLKTTHTELDFQSKGSDERKAFRAYTKPGRKFRAEWYALNENKRKININPV